MALFYAYFHQNGDLEMSKQGLPCSHILQPGIVPLTITPRVFVRPNTASFGRLLLLQIIAHPAE